MTLNGVMALILHYFTEFVYDVVVKSSRSLSHLLMSFLLRYASGQTHIHADTLNTSHHYTGVEVKMLSLYITPAGIFALLCKYVNVKVLVAR